MYITCFNNIYDLEFQFLNSRTSQGLYEPVLNSLHVYTGKVAKQTCEDKLGTSCRAIFNMADFSAWHLLEWSDTTWGVTCFTSSRCRLENMAAWSGIFTPNTSHRHLLNVCVHRQILQLETTDGQTNFVSSAYCKCFTRWQHKYRPAAKFLV